MDWILNRRAFRETYRTSSFGESSILLHYVECYSSRRHFHSSTDEGVTHEFSGSSVLLIYTIDVLGMNEKKKEFKSYGRQERKMLNVIGGATNVWRDLCASNALIKSWWWITARYTLLRIEEFPSMPSLIVVISIFHSLGGTASFVLYTRFGCVFHAVMTKMSR